MLDVATEFAAPMLLSYANAGVVYPRLADQHHALAPYGVFATAATAREILIAVHQDAEWRAALRRLIEQPALGADPRFATTLDRVAHRELVGEHRRRRPRPSDLREAVERPGGRRHRARARQRHARTGRATTWCARRGIIDAGATARDGSSVQSFVGIAERLFDPDGDRDSRPPDLDEHGRAARRGAEGSAAVA